VSGIEYAEQYADLITRLYLVDRGDTGRALTRCAVLPLAEVMLIRDLVYVASMAASPEQRSRMRARLNVKLARGDHVERRYLTRIDVLAFSRRIRADVRTSDWPARLIIAAGRRIIPNRWRGSRRDRQVRQFMMDFIRRALAEAPGNYAAWSDAMNRLHLQAAEDRLRAMALAEVRMLAESGVGAPVVAPDDQH
jgi:hypothetical protein